MNAKVIDFAAKLHTLIENVKKEKTINLERS